MNNMNRNNGELASATKSFVPDFCNWCRLRSRCEVVPEIKCYVESHYATQEKPEPAVIWEEVDGKMVPVVSAVPISLNHSSPSVEASTLGREGYSFDPDEYKCGCYLSSDDGVVACGKVRVSEGIGDDYKIHLVYNKRGQKLKISPENENGWNSRNYVVISAPTGQGKNHASENVIIPYLENLNYENETTLRMLIISNRLALKQQQKERINGTDDSDEIDGKIYRYSHKNCVDVMTYQSMLLLKDWLEQKQQKESRYAYVICDEAHFFTSDASFNPHTEKILSAIVKVFHNACRIYMSATPYECLPFISKHEHNGREVRYYNKDHGNRHPAKRIVYHFDRDYSYLDVKTYSETSELYDLIIESTHGDHPEKWLIFIDDKKKCASVKKELEERGEELGIPMVKKDGESEIFAVDAGSKRNEDYLKILSEEQLGGYNVLLSTSVLDNGVNLRDVDHIVVSDMSKEKVLQMVGRARVRKNETTGEYIDRKTLYLKRFSCRYVTCKLAALKKQRDAYHMYDIAYGNYNYRYSRKNDVYEFNEKYIHGEAEDSENGRHWFGFSPDDPEKPYFNPIARTLMERQIVKCEAIRNEMERERQLSEDLEGQLFLECQLSWFGKRYNPDDDLTVTRRCNAKENFASFLEGYASEGTRIEKDHQKEFSEKFTSLHDAAFGRADKNTKRGYGIDKINKILCAQNSLYKVISEGTPVCWVVVRNNDPESDQEA